MSKPKRKEQVRYLCIVHGQQERMYFRHLQSLIEDKGRRNVVFSIQEGDRFLMERVLKQVKYSGVYVFDHDLDDDGFRDNIEKCQELSKKRFHAKVVVAHAYSNICFDLWLLLHKTSFNNPQMAPSGYHHHVRTEFGLEKNANIKSADSMKKILRVVSLEDVISAIGRVERIREGKIQTDGVNIGEYRCYDNPDLSIHEFIKSVLVECGIMRV